MSSKRKSARGIDEETYKTTSKKQRTNEELLKDKSLVSKESEASASIEQNYDTIKLLAEEGFEDVSKILQDNGVTSNALSRVTESQLEELGIRPQKRREDAVECIQKITERLYGKGGNTTPVNSPKADMNVYETPPNSRYWVSFPKSNDVCIFKQSSSKRPKPPTPNRSSKGRPRRISFN